MICGLTLWQNVGQSAKIRVGAIVLVFICIFFYVDLKWNFPTDPENVTRTLYSVEKIPQRKVITKLTLAVDQEWLPVLKQGNIISIKPIKAEVSGLAEKWLAVFESGHEAMIKPVEAWSFLDRHWPIIDYDSSLETKGWRIRKADRKMQGCNEIVGYYLDRVMGFNRKPPIVGRYLSSKILYSYAFKKDDDIVWSPYDTFAKVKNLMFDQAIPVSVHAWFDGLEKEAPPQITQEYLTIQTKPRQVLGNWEKTYAADVSDTIVFDFLIDDHDRNKEHNWIADGFHNLLLWDSGLAFNHGPNGRESCVRILCGPEKWLENPNTKEGEASCTKICRFRSSTINQLYSMSSQLVEFEDTLGGRLKEAMKEDLLDPVFQFNLYYLSGKWPKTRFTEDNFFTGLNVKVERLLTHVDECINTYGRERVLINY